MTEIVTPNWLVLIGFLFLSCAFVLISKSLVGSLGRGFDERGARQAACQQRVDGLMSVPFAATGVVLMMAAQFYRADISPSMVILALSAAAALIIYWGVEGLFVERLIDLDQRKREAVKTLPISHSEPVQSELRPALQIVQTS